MKDALLERLRNARPGRIYAICTGAGAGLQRALWGVPGCSVFFAGAEFPYAKDQIDRCLGFVPEGSYCSARGAMQLAIRAYYRAWTTLGQPATGIGVSAVVATKEQHRGDHRIYVAIVADSGCYLRSVRLAKGSGGTWRGLDGAIADDLALGTLCDNLNIQNRLSVASGVDAVLDDRRADADALDALLEYPYFAPEGMRAKTVETSYVLFPGAFNPPHDGHRELADAARRACDVDAVLYSITADAPHKPPLSAVELLQRAKMLSGEHVLFSTGDALYIDKARRHAAQSIIIGADACARMLDPGWGPNIEAMCAEFESLGTHFLVAPRDGVHLLHLRDRIPVGAGQNFHALGSRDLGLSSTQLRNGKWETPP